MSRKHKPESSKAPGQKRVNNSPIARWEKKTLPWLAARTPAWVTPDMLTVVGLIACGIILAGYALSHVDKGFLWLASLGFVINWYGDSMDGSLARYRQIERPRYGYFVDHIADVVGQLFIFVGMGLSPYLHLNLALVLMISYLMGSIYVYLATYTSGIFQLSYDGIGPTEFRLVAIAINTFVFFFGNPSFTIPGLGLLKAPLTLSAFDCVVVAVILFITYEFIVNSIKTGRLLAREEPPAPRQQGGAA